MNKNYKNKIVLIKGSGSIANKHIHILLKLKIKIYVLIKKESEKKKFLKNYFKKISFIKSINKNDNKKILFAIIATSTNKHLNDINYFIKKKINIFCEKPITNSLNNLNKIRNDIIKNKIHFYVNYQLKQHECIGYINKIINNNKIYYVESKVGQNLKYWRKNKIRKNSYYLDVNKGGGVIYELIHEINLINYLFGEITYIKTIKKKHNLKNAEDQAISIFKTKKKVNGILIQDMVSENKERYIKILCQSKSIIFDLIKNKITFYNKNNIKHLKLKNNDQISLITKNIIHYMRILKDNKFSISYFDEAVRDLKICKKMHESN